MHDQVCRTGKAQHITAPSAWREARRLMRRNHTHAMTVYRCSYCGQWHCTHIMGEIVPQSKRRAMVYGEAA